MFLESKTEVSANIHKCVTNTCDNGLKKAAFPFYGQMWIKLAPTVVSVIHLKYLTCFSNFNNWNCGVPIFTQQADGILYRWALVSHALTLKNTVRERTLPGNFRYNTEYQTVSRLRTVKHNYLPLIQINSLRNIAAWS